MAPMYSAAKDHPIGSTIPFAHVPVSHPSDEGLISGAGRPSQEECRCRELAEQVAESEDLHKALIKVASAAVAETAKLTVEKAVWIDEKQELVLDKASLEGQIARLELEVELARANESRSFEAERRGRLTGHTNGRLSELDLFEAYGARLTRLQARRLREPHPPTNHLAYEEAAGPPPLLKSALKSGLRPTQSVAWKSPLEYYREFDSEDGEPYGD